MRSYALPGHGALLLRVPRSWKDEMKQPRGEVPPTIALHPAVKQDPIVLVTPLWSMKGEQGFNAPEKVRDLVGDQMRRMAPSAVEKELVPEALRGEEAAGFFFTATDKAPKMGDYEYLVQGALAVGGLLVTATILSHTKDSEGMRQALAVLSDARHKRP